MVTNQPRRNVVGLFRCRLPTAPQKGTHLRNWEAGLQINAWKPRFAGTFELKRVGRSSSMQTFLIVLLIWCAPSFLFVGWRLWMSRPIRDVHYRHRWESSHA